MKTKLYRPHYFAVLVALLLSTSFRAIAQPVAPRTLPAPTEKKLRELLADPAVQSAHIGLSIMALGTAKTPQEFPARPYTEQPPVLFEVNGDKRFMPASNVKLYTAAYALQRSPGSHWPLNPWPADYLLRPNSSESAEFKTVIVSDAHPNKDVLDGNVYLLGDGDPSLSTDGINKMARAVAARGIKTIKGQVVAVAGGLRGETFGGRYPDGWTLDDTLWYYGPEISSLAINRNHVDVTITGADAPGKMATMQIDPPTEGLQIKCLVQTGAPELASTSSIGFLNFNRVDRDAVPEQRSAVITITGKVAPGQKITEGVAIPNPPYIAGLALKKALADNGVQVEGKFIRPKRQDYGWTRPGYVVPREFPGGVFVGHRPYGYEWEPGIRLSLDYNSDWPTEPLPVLARHRAPAILLQRLLKNSDNLYAEMLLRGPALRTEGYEQELRSAPRAHALMFRWLRENKVDTTGLRFTDGSGLSRYNMITPRATAQLLAAVNVMPSGKAFWEAMPIAGVDGTLRNRMRSTPAANNARAKTGTFSIVSTLSGYVTTRDGHRLAVSLLTNFAPDGTAVRTWQDKMYSALADADWSTPAAN